MCFGLSNIDEHNFMCYSCNRLIVLNVERCYIYRVKAMAKKDIEVHPEFKPGSSELVMPKSMRTR